MPVQTVNVTAAFEVEGVGGVLSPLKLADLQVSDPAAGPGALDASVLAVRASVDALSAQLTTPIPVSLGSPVTLGAAVDVEDRPARVLGHVQVDDFPALQAVSGTIDVGNFPATQAISAVALPLPTGAATAARQDAQEATLTTLAGVDYATEATLDAIAAALAVPADQVTTLTPDRKTVAAAGTAEAISASLVCKWVVVSALLSNTQQVNVGGAGVLATPGASTGTPLWPGGSITIPVGNASEVFVDARVPGEGVSFTVGS